MWLALCLSVCAYTVNAAEPVRGVLLEREGDEGAGQMSVRGADFQVRVLLYDGATAIQREERAVTPAALRPGDLLEAFCNGEPEPRCRAARIVVAKPAPVSSTGWRPTGWGRPDWGPSWPPRGQLLLAGVIAERYADGIRLRTRRGGEYLLRLREDTSLIGDGLAAGAAQLRVNMRVFVRAGKGLEGELEAFQVVWGRILPAR